MLSDFAQVIALTFLAMASLSGLGILGGIALAKWRERRYLKVVEELDKEQ